MLVKIYSKLLRSLDHIFKILHFVWQNCLANQNKHINEAEGLMGKIFSLNFHVFLNLQSKNCITVGLFNETAVSPKYLWPINYGFVWLKVFQTAEASEL